MPLKFEPRRRPEEAHRRASRRKEFLLLQDTSAGKAMALMFFENEDDYRQGDETLNSMSPPGGGMGERVSVEKFELAVNVEA